MPPDDAPPASPSAPALTPTGTPISSLDALAAAKAPAAPAAPVTPPADPAAPPAAEAAKPPSVLGEKGEGDKPPETKPGDAPAPLAAADLKLPEGFKAEGNPEFDSFLKAFNDPALSPKDRAQAILDLHTKALASQAEAAQRQWDEIATKWRGDIAQDKEFGTGDPKNPLKPEAKAAISKLIDAYGGTPVREALDLTGAGNNPALVSFMGKISKLLTEGGHVAGNPLSKKPSGVGASALYPDLPEA